MAIKKQEINYPKEGWVDEWVDKWLDNHPNEKVEDFHELEEQAMEAWWLNEIEHDRPTPFDLTPEQEKASQEARKGMAHNFEKRKEPVKRERKPNEAKQELIQTMNDALVELVGDVTISNKERTLDFEWQGVKYTVMLTAHRPPKGK